MRSPDAGLPGSLAASLWRLGLSTPWWLTIPLALLATELLPLPFDYAADFFFPHQLSGGPNIRSHGIGYALIARFPLASYWVTCSLSNRCGEGEPSRLSLQSMRYDMPFPSHWFLACSEKYVAMSAGRRARHRHDSSDFLQTS
jgi:hypothetical protein